MITLGMGSLADVSLLISQGSTNTYSFVYSRMIAGVKTAVNLSGFTVKSQIRARVGGPLYLQLDPYITLGSDGSVVLLIPASVTQAPVWSTYRKGVWDLELTETSSGVVVRFVSGLVTVSADVTRVDV